jgi:hypothetical protein
VFRLVGAGAVKRPFAAPPVSGLTASPIVDLAGLRLLRHLADQVDMEQAVVEARAIDLHVVGEAEAALEGAPGDAAVQIAALRLLVFLLRLARNHQRVLLHGDVDLVAREPRHRHRQAVGVFAGRLDIVRRVGGSGRVNARGAVDQASETIEADRRTE